MWERLNCICIGICWWLPDVNLATTNNKKGILVPFKQHQYLWGKRASWMSQIWSVHWKLWEYGPHRFLHFPVGVSPLVQKTVHRNMRVLKFKSSKIVWEPFFCRSQHSGPEWFPEFVGEILWQKFKFVAEIWISWQKYILIFVRKTTSTSTSISPFCGSTGTCQLWNFHFFRPTVLRLQNQTVHNAVKKCLMIWLISWQVLKSVLN